MSKESRDPKRDLLLNHDSPSKGRAWGVRNEDDRTMDLDNQGVADLQQTLMKNQDEKLDDLVSSVERQKELSLDINYEVNSQTRLLDDIDSKVDRTNNKIVSTTQRVEKTRLKASTKGMLFCICFLILILIGVVIAAAKT